MHFLFQYGFRVPVTSHSGQLDALFICSKVPRVYHLIIKYLDTTHLAFFLVFFFFVLIFFLLIVSRHQLVLMENSKGAEALWSHYMPNSKGVVRTGLFWPLPVQSLCRKRGCLPDLVQWAETPFFSRGQSSCTVSTGIYAFGYKSSFFSKPSSYASPKNATYLVPLSVSGAPLTVHHLNPVLPCSKLPLLSTSGPHFLCYDKFSFFFF